jgi:hypothetical protein
MDAKADRPLTIRLTDLMSDDTLLHGKVGFWKRQFQLRPTTGQRTFDVLFGVLTPLLCLILDPGILRQGSISVEPFLENWSVYVHTEIAIGLFLLCFFLAFQRASPILAGALLGCGVFSLLLGLLLLPLSMLALLTEVPTVVFGFTPILTGFVFMRNACRCCRVSFQSCASASSHKRAAATIALVVVVTLIIPGVPDWVVSVMVGPPPPSPSL